MKLFPGLESLQNVHPLFVHFPVALVLVTLLFEAFWWISGKDNFRLFATYLLYLSAISAITAVVTGYIASNGLGHDSPGHEFVHQHRDIMLWMSGMLLFTTLVVIFIRPLREGKQRRLLIFPLLVISSLLVYGADKGGRLVFEFGTGVKAVSKESLQKSFRHEHEEPEKTVPEQPETLPDTSSKTEEPSHDHEHDHSH